MMVQAGFAECWARSYFSFLEATSAPEALVEKAVELGMPALGLVDRGGLYGAVRCVSAAQRAGIGAMVGAELNLASAGRLVLMATDQGSYQQLCKAVSLAQLSAPKGAHKLYLADLDPLLAAAAGVGLEVGLLSEGASASLSAEPALLAGKIHPRLVSPAQLNRCTVIAGGPASPVSMALLRGDRVAADAVVRALVEAFAKEQVYLCLQHHLHPGDSWLAAETVECAQRVGVGLLASAAPRYAHQSQAQLLDVLTAIRENCTLEEAAARGLLPGNHHYAMRGAEELAQLLPYPQAFRGSAELALRAELKLDFRHSRFPGFKLPADQNPDQYLRQLCRTELPRKYQPVTPEVEARLGHELEVIASCHLSEFFLIVWELMDFAKRQDIPAQGRGSAADSLVAYLLDITRVDPIAHHLLFERFLHEDMKGTPDIDIDISTAHREQLIQHVYQTYGQERTGMVCTVITFRPRLAIRQVGAAFGLPPLLIEKLSRSVDRWYGKGDAALMAEVLTVAGEDPDQVLQSALWQQFTLMVEAIVGVPRHLSIHVGGMLVTGEPLWEVAPLERATMPGRVVVQFDKDDVEDLGLIKIDLLGLRTLSVIHEALAALEAVTGQRPDLAALDLADPKVYQMCSAADTIGVFQIESRAQQQTLPRSRPTEFNDLVVEVAIIRPGPIQGKAVHPYLRRRQGREQVSYLHPRLEPILKDTLGVILYQEQILEIAMQLAGFSAGEADRFRRAMNRHRSRVEMTSLEESFRDGCLRQGVAAQVASQLFEAVKGFAEFGFCKSHAAAFARTTYETAWLRLYHPAAFLVGLLNHQPMGFYHPSVLVEDAKRRGVKVLPVDVNRSPERCWLEWLPARGSARPELGVRLGFNYVRALGPVVRDRLIQGRGAGDYRSPEELWRRTGLSRPALESLVMVGAMDSFGAPRRELLWRLKAVEEELEESGGRGRSGGRGEAGGSIASQEQLLPLPAPAPPLPELTPGELAAADYRIMGLTTGPHLVSFLRPRLGRMGAMTLAAARGSKPGERVLVAGLVITRQAPSTAHGLRFFTLEDETGHLDLIFKPPVYRAYRSLANHHPLLCAAGSLQGEGGVMSLIVEQLRDLYRTVPAGGSAGSGAELLALDTTLSHDYH